MIEPRWKRRLVAELEAQRDLKALKLKALEGLARTRRLTSDNHDTVVSLDWPHYCGHATEACGGARGWCYTLSGHHASAQQAAKVGVVDQLARRNPRLFADIVAEEVLAQVKAGKLPYPNLRYSGSGELHESHVDAVREVSARGVRLWGFTRDVALASRLRSFGIGVIVSCDLTTPPAFVTRAQENQLPLAYTSRSVDDQPPSGTVVTFPVHLSGRVREVPSHPSLCPKVVEEYLKGNRHRAWCQQRCHRCHQR